MQQQQQQQQRSKDELLALIDTQEKYNEFKAFLAAARLRQIYPVGPLYQSLPLAANAYDRYNVDRQLFSTDYTMLEIYSRIVHGNLTGQYRMAANGAIPWLATTHDLDWHALDTYLAPFKPAVSLPTALSAIRPWDRNTKEFFPNVRSYPYNHPRRYFKNGIATLVPLYQNYRQGNGKPNRIGVPLNRNTTTIVNYIQTMLNSLNTYKNKVNAVASLVHSTDKLKKLRTELIDRLAVLQQNKMRNLNDLANDPKLNRTQRDIISSFVAQYERTMLQLANAANK